MEKFRQFLSTGIAVVAVVISLFTLYWTSLRPAAITISAGESMQIYHDERRLLNVDLPVVFKNSGAQSGVVRSLAIIFKDPRNEDALFFKWVGFKSIINGQWEYESQRTPASVPEGGEVAMMVNFRSSPSEMAWLPDPITYDVYLLVWTSSTEVPDIRHEMKWTFSEDDVNSIKTNLEAGRFIGRWVTSSEYASESRSLSVLEFGGLIK